MIPICDVDTFVLAASQDPYTPLHRLREHAPISWSDAESAWVLVGFRDVSSVVADRRFGVSDISAMLDWLAEASGRDLTDLSAVLRSVLFLRNPPAHTIERRFLARVLGAWPLSSYEPTIVAIAERLLAPARRDGGLDLATGFADLLPPMVMAHMFGISTEEALALVDLANQLTLTLDRGRSPRFYQAMNEKAAAARRIMADTVRLRRIKPGDDALSRMIALNDAEFGLDDLEVATRGFFLFLAGVETTSALIGSALLALMQHPAELARLRGAEISGKDAFEELARFASPVQQVTRLATEDVAVGGQTIQSGQRAVLMIGVANRDPAIYPDPDRLLLGRAGPGNLAFGAGLHHCIGMGLARLETYLAVGAFARLPMPRLLADEPAWLPHRTQRRLKKLPATFA